MEVSAYASKFVWPESSSVVLHDLGNVLNVTGNSQNILSPNSPVAVAAAAEYGLSPLPRSCSGLIRPHFEHGKVPVQSTVSGQKGAKSDRYKTELCRQFSENGSCRYSDKCQFAHGASELRTVARHPKYKTDLCKTFHSTGFCPYGARCHFVHSEARPKVESGMDDVFSVAEPGWKDVHPSFSRATTSSNLAQTRQKESSSGGNLELRYGTDLHKLIIGMNSLLSQPSASNSFAANRLQPPKHFRPSFSGGTEASPPSDGWQPSFFHSHDSMGSSASSPTFSVNDSPNPSPTSLELTSNDFWSSLANIIGN